ncbi:hypothetical protein V6N11_001266 [Hibiscus sabdariffa]|uniref:DUF4283 domain-containing protein n=1 Tax=Hibiscus sabdariffa TaxID=183260 RepID=A0ABR2RZ75_9ROSI
MTSFWRRIRMDVLVGVNHSEGMTKTTMGDKECRCIQGSVEESKVAILHIQDAVLDSRNLQECFERVELWSSEIKMKSRRVWIAIQGLLIHALSQASFASIANVWGKFVCVDDVNLAHTSFERGYVLIEMNCVGQINDWIDIKVEDLVYRILVTESDWNDPMMECECGSDDSSRSALHVSNTYAMDSSIQKVAYEVVSGQDLGRRSGDVNAPNLIGSTKPNPGWLNKMWEDNRWDDLRVVSGPSNQVSNSGDFNLNMQRGDKAESGDVVEEVRSSSPSSPIVEPSSSERVTSSLADPGVVQVSLRTNGVVASKRGRGRPRKGSGVSGSVDAEKSLQFCHSQDSLRLRCEIDGCWVWEVSRFSMEAVEVDRNFILIQGMWLKEDIMCYILTVYALCDGRDQARLWDSILHRVSAFLGEWSRLSSSGIGAGNLLVKLRHMKTFLKSWNKTVFGDIEAAIEVLNKKIEDVDVLGPNDLADDLVAQCRERMQNLWHVLQRRNRCGDRSHVLLG